MKTLRLLLAASVVWVGLAPRAPVEAQSDPRQVLAGMIYQVSTGSVNPNWYSPVLYQTIAVQTSYTGIYPQLRQLGTVTNVIVTQSVPLPGGTVYAMTAMHQFGVSYWEFAIGSYTNRIEYASFNVGPAAGPATLPGQPTSGQPAVQQQPSAPPPTVGQPPADPPAKPAPTPNQSEACKKFPSLC